MPRPENTALIDGVVRQSTLRTFDQCPKRALHEVTLDGDWSNEWAAFGTAFHAVAEEILRTLRRTGEERVPTEEALVIMREVACRPDTPHLTDVQLRDLRIVTLQFSDVAWGKARLVAIEERLWADIPCPDGQTRRLTGRPDVLLGDPPGGAICLDFKTGFAIPKSPPRDGNWERDAGRTYLSERGHFQLDLLCVLVLSTFPRLERVILREYYPRRGEFREAHLERIDLEDVLHRLGIMLQRFELVLAGEIVPEPRAGAHCSHCPLRFEGCPIPPWERGEGMIRSDEEADRLAERFIVVHGERKGLRAALKAHHGETGYVPAVGVGHREFPWLPEPDEEAPAMTDAERASGEAAFDAL